MALQNRLFVVGMVMAVFVQRISSISSHQRHRVTSRSEAKTKTTDERILACEVCRRNGFEEFLQCVESQMGHLFAEQHCKDKSTRLARHPRRRPDRGEWKLVMTCRYCVTSWRDEFGLTISIRKTNVLGQYVEIPPSINIDDATLEGIDSFTYFGSTITSNMSLDSELSTRIAKAAAVMQDGLDK
ncbi:hypothetical protein LSAT2_017445 [Lamellibrachia satsuma]|nr:hypothetical protein LSAT2_017445 [Lamellibrachia satsuma]